MADTDVTKMKVADLKRELKIRGLMTTGNKNDLVERLQAAIIEGDVFDETGISEDLLDEGDDVLNDDELEEETSLLNASTHDEDVILKSPQGSTTSKSPDDLAASTAPSSQQKKVILKRKLITTISINENDDSKSETAAPSTEASASKSTKLDDNGETNGSNGEDKKLLKLSELTMKERLELRAKKFGAAPSVDALKQARAERFGISATSTTTTGKSDSDSAKMVSTPASVDLLKKRAERFGGSVSTTMSKIENKEKLEKRQQRFGGASAPVNADPKVASEYAEKAKLRLERFKTSAK